jgi:hypothetical protein
LLEIHGDLGGGGPGRRWRLGVLNKSAVVLITAFWEAYCEDIAAEGLAHFTRHAKGANDLPEALRRLVAKELEADPHELAVWRLAGDGWRGVLSSRLESLRQERNRRLNTPKAEQIDELFERALGIARMSRAWYWAGMSANNAAEKLDRYVTLRGEIAHRGTPVRSVPKNQVVDYYTHVKRLVAKTDQRVNKLVISATKQELG